MQEIPILFLDDDKALIRMYKTYLEAKGYRSILIRNGQNGVRRAINEGPSLVTLKASSLTKKEKDKDKHDMPVLIFTNTDHSEHYKIEQAIKSSDVMTQIKSTQQGG